MDETDYNYPYKLNVLSWVLGGITLFVTLVRIIGRSAVLRQPGLDDIFMGISTVMALICSALVTVAVSYGLGMHISSIEDPVRQAQAFKYTVLAPVWAILSSTFGKVSILIFLLRLLGVGTKRWHKRFLSVLCGLMIALNAAAIVTVVGFCSPPAAQWDPSVNGKCMSANIQLWVCTTQAAYNAVMDIIVALFPILIIRKLSITRKMKVGLCLLMSGGIFAAAATVVKVYLFKDIDQHADITWTWSLITLWYTAEMDVIIIFGTIPALWPLFRYFSNQYQQGRYRLGCFSGERVTGGDFDSTMYYGDDTNTRATPGASLHSRRQPSRGVRELGHSTAGGYAVHMTRPLSQLAKPLPTRTRGKARSENDTRRGQGIGSLELGQRDDGGFDTLPPNVIFHLNSDDSDRGQRRHRRSSNSKRDCLTNRPGPLTQMLQDIDDLQTWQSRQRTVDDTMNNT